MKIGLFHVTATLKVGGSETYVWRLGRHLTDRGHICHLWGGETPEPIIGDPLVTLRTAPFTPRERVWKLGSRFQKMMERLSFARQARQAMKREGYEIINIHKPYDLPLALWLKKVTGCRIVWRCHGTDFFPGLGTLLRRVDGIYCVSKFAHDILVKAYPVRAEVIYTGVDTLFFDPETEITKTSDAPRILYFGRLEGLKGVRSLIEALVSLEPHPWTAQIIGDGPQENELGDLIGRRGLTHRIRMLPAVKNRQQVRRLLAESDIVVFPSLADETFSNAILEAMSMAKAVIATNIGGFPEVVNHTENGWLVPPGNPEALSELIRRLLADPQLRQFAGKNARDRVKRHFEAKASFDRVEALFTHLLKH